MWAAILGATFALWLQSGCSSLTPAQRMDRLALKNLSNYVAFLPNVTWIGRGVPNTRQLCFEDEWTKTRGLVCVTMGQARDFAFGQRKAN